jgi:hypothetical protein
VHRYRAKEIPDEWFVLSYSNHFFWTNSAIMNAVFAAREWRCDDATSIVPVRRCNGDVILDEYSIPKSKEFPGHVAIALTALTAALSIVTCWLFVRRTQARWIDHGSLVVSTSVSDGSFVLAPLAEPLVELDESDLEEGASFSPGVGRPMRRVTSI